MCSMISEQIKELRLFAEKSKQLDRNIDARIFKEAADTIEALSAKLAAANMERSTKYFDGSVDLIDRNHLLSEIMSYTYDSCNLDKCRMERIVKAHIIEIIEKEKNYNANMERYYGGGWIACNDRLPEEDGFYIATLDGEIIGGDEPFSGMAEFENGKWVDDEEDYKCVLAWMQKPTPYHPKEGATNVEEKKTD